jgi:hypothetical protein
VTLYRTLDEFKAHNEKYYASYTLDELTAVFVGSARHMDFWCSLEPEMQSLTLDEKEAIAAFAYPKIKNYWSHNVLGYVRMGQLSEKIFAAVRAGDIEKLSKLDGEFHNVTADDKLLRGYLSSKKKKPKPPFAGTPTAKKQFSFLESEVWFLMAQGRNWPENPNWPTHEEMRKRIMDASMPIEQMLVDNDEWAAKFKLLRDEMLALYERLDSERGFVAARAFSKFVWEDLVKKYVSKSPRKR